MSARRRSRVRITWWVADGGVLVSGPVGLTVAWTSFGATKTPPLATALYASSTWSALTASTWPMGSETKSVGSHWAAVASSPGDSPGKLNPVGCPKPSALTWLSRRCSPTPCAISEVPILEDCARICVAVSVSVGWGSASWKVDPSNLIWSGTVKTEFGLIRLSCQGRREGDELEHRARLVELADGEVARGLVDRVVRDRSARPLLPPEGSCRSSRQVHWDGWRRDWPWRGSGPS